MTAKENLLRIYSTIRIGVTLGSKRYWWFNGPEGGQIILLTEKDFVCQQITDDLLWEKAWEKQQLFMLADLMK